MEEQKHYRVSPQIYRNNLIALIVFLCAFALIGFVSAYNFGHLLLICSVVAALIIMLVWYFSRQLPKLKQIIVIDQHSITCVSGSEARRLEWNEVSRVRGAFNASDIVICGRGSKVAFTIFRLTEGLQELVNALLRHVAPEAIGTGSSAHGIKVEGDCVVLELAKTSRRVPLREITDLWIEYDSRPSALTKLVIDCAGTRAHAIGISNYILEGYGIIRRALSPRVRGAA